MEEGTIFLLLFALLGTASALSFYGDSISFMAPQKNSDGTFEVQNLCNLFNFCISLYIFLYFSKKNKTATFIIELGVSQRSRNKYLNLSELKKV